jgi:ribosomal-protein-alanine N-acetyltransferase
MSPDYSMLAIETDRLILVTTPVAVMETRLFRDDFEADLCVVESASGSATAADRALRVHFPSEWPGEALALLPRWIRQRSGSAGRETMAAAIFVTVVDLRRREAAGALGFMDLPSQDGTVELGFGINPAYRMSGYATEATRALVTWALSLQAVQRITAECLVQNVASRRVLEKAGFTMKGQRASAEGQRYCWQADSGEGVAHDGWDMRSGQ